MRYMGGKSRISKQISEVINNAIHGRQEPNLERNSSNPYPELGGAKYICKPVLWVFLVMFGITILIISALVAFI